MVKSCPNYIYNKNNILTHVLRTIWSFTNKKQAANKST